MVWSPIDAAKLIVSEFDFSGIAYRQRVEDGKFNAELNGEESDGWLGADRIGTGFMLLTRFCLNNMAEEYAHTEYTEDGTLRWQILGRGLHLLPQMERDRRIYMGHAC